MDVPAARALEARRHQPASSVGGFPAHLHQAVEGGGGPSAVEGGGGGFDPGGQVADDPGGEEGGGGVEDDDVAVRAGLAVEDRPGEPGVGGGVAADEVLGDGQRDAQLGGVEVGEVDLAVGHLPHRRGGGGRQLVEPVVAEEHQRPLGAELHQGGDHPLGHGGVAHADRLAPGAGRVGQRPEEVERRRHAQLPADGPGVPQRLVIAGGEAEADPDLVDAAGHPGRAELDVHAERLEEVGGAAGRRRRPVAVLGHPGAGAGGHEGGQGRDVDAARPVAAGAAGVEQRPGDVDPLGVGQHRADEGGHLGRRLPLGPQGDGEAGDLGRRGPPLEDRGQGTRRPRRR